MLPMRSKEKERISCGLGEASRLDPEVGSYTSIKIITPEQKYEDIFSKNEVRKQNKEPRTDWMNH